jgi:hypothetical protein
MLLAVHRVVLRLAAAAAAARSDFPDTFRWAIRGRLLVAGAGAPLMALLIPAPAGGTADCRLGPLGPLLTGELPDTWRSDTITAPFLKLVAGGSGRGRTRDDAA